VWADLMTAVDSPIARQHARLDEIVALCESAQAMGQDEEKWDALAAMADKVMVEAVQSDFIAVLAHESRDDLAALLKRQEEVTGQLSDAMMRVRERLENLNARRLAPPSGPSMLDLEG